MIWHLLHRWFGIHCWVPPHEEDDHHDTCAICFARREHNYGGGL
jgi:hypothetical protein